VAASLLSVNHKTRATRTGDSQARLGGLADCMGNNDGAVDLVSSPTFACRSSAESLPASRDMRPTAKADLTAQADLGHRAGSME
jgi:hypothetical protein